MVSDVFCFGFWILHHTTSNHLHTRPLLHSITSLFLILLMASAVFQHQPAGLRILPLDTQLLLRNLKCISFRKNIFNPGLISCKASARSDELNPRKMDQSKREECEFFSLGDFQLREGATLREAKLAYKTWGTLNDDRSNAILYPTWYSGRHWDNDWLIGPGMGLDPSTYFIIVPNMLGNGLSTSPSNSLPPYNQARFPKVTTEDNVRAQYKLVAEEFGINKLKLVIGWSMGAGQTFQWAVSYPEMVERILPFCGSARTSPHNIVFLEGVEAALRADSNFKEGWYPDLPQKGLRAAARVYAGWGFSQAFYWNEVWRELGYNSLEDFLVGFWEGFFLDRRDPNNLLLMLWTWKNNNVGQTCGFEGNLEKALASIKAKAIVMSAERDLYFPPEDEEYEVQFIPSAEFRVIPGIWGHFAGAGFNVTDTQFIDNAVKDLLAT